MTDYGHCSLSFSKALSGNISVWTSRQPKCGNYYFGKIRRARPHGGASSTMKLIVQLPIIKLMYIITIIVHYVILFYRRRFIFSFFIVSFLFF